MSDWFWAWVPLVRHELIAVGRRLATRWPGHAAGAAGILDDHLLAENFRQPRRHDPPHDSTPPPAANGTTMVIGRLGQLSSSGGIGIAIQQDKCGGNAYQRALDDVRLPGLNMAGLGDGRFGRVPVEIRSSECRDALAAAPRSG